MKDHDYSQGSPSGLFTLYLLLVYSSFYQARWSGCQPLTKVKNPWGEGWMRQTHYEETAQSAKQKRWCEKR